MTAKPEAERTPSDTPEGQSPQAGRPHLLFLDGVRGAAALYVVIYHAVVVNSSVLGFPSSGMKWLVAPFNFGHQAVAAFIALSGFCLVIPTLNKNFALPGGAKVFYLRRAWRILPPYYAAVLLTLICLPAILLAFPTDPTLSGMLRECLAPSTQLGHLFLVQDTREWLTTTFNGSLWSISVECRIYLLFPLLCLIAARRDVFTAAASGFFCRFCFA